VDWAQVQEARLVRGYRSTGFCPRLRTRGTAYAGLRSGYFRLANGREARVFLQDRSVDAVWLRTPKGELLYAPDAFEPFLAQLREGGVLP